LINELLMNENKVTCLNLGVWGLGFGVWGLGYKRVYHSISRSPLDPSLVLAILIVRLHVPPSFKNESERTDIIQII